MTAERKNHILVWRGDILNIHYHCFSFYYDLVIPILSLLFSPLLVLLFLKYQISLAVCAIKLSIYLYRYHATTLFPPRLSFRLLFFCSVNYIYIYIWYIWYHISSHFENHCDDWQQLRLISTKQFAAVGTLGHAANRSGQTSDVVLAQPASLANSAN